MKCLVLAAGYGTRLYPIITDTSKSLLPVGSKLLINHILDKVENLEGLNEVIVVTNNKFHGDFCAWAEQEKNFSAPITVVNDGTLSPEDRLGSVGDIRFVIDHQCIEDDLLVVGGDNLFDYSLEDSIAFARRNRPHVSIGLYDIHELEGATKFGVVETDSNGKITSFEEKPEKPKSTLVAMCYYYFPRKSLALIEDYIRQFKKTDKAGDYIQWLVSSEEVYGFKFEGRWYDIGSIESYQDAQEKFKDQ